jgi:hypothetical protein
MDDGKLSFTLRQVGNGWVLEVCKDGDCVEFIFTRHGKALSTIRQILNADLDPFADSE